MKNRLPWGRIIFAVFIVACLGAWVAAALVLRYGTDLYVLLQQQTALKVGSPAPDFALDSLEGSPLQLRQFRGQPVMLTFAASWCPACREEAPFQQALHVRHRELVMLLVDSDEPADAVRRFASDYGMTFPVLLDSTDRVARRYHIYAIPTTFFIDADGILRGILVDGLTEQTAEAQLPLIGIEP